DRTEPLEVGTPSEVIVPRCCWLGWRQQHRCHRHPLAWHQGRGLLLDCDSHMRRRCVHKASGSELTHRHPNALVTQLNRLYAAHKMERAGLVLEDWSCDFEGPDFRGHESDASGGEKREKRSNEGAKFQTRPD